MTSEQCSDFYSEHYGKKFFPGLVNFMTSGPILAMVLAKENAIQQWRDLIGPTNSTVAKENNPTRLEIEARISGRRDRTFVFVVFERSLAPTSRRMQCTAVTVP